MTVATTVGTMATANGELGDFLSAQRSRVAPGDVGLPALRGRRVAGLRREEVAVLAGVSADYYARLEQGRERTPSAQVVDAICSALRLSPDARAHTYRLARLAPSEQTGDRAVSPELLQLMDSFPNAAAYVVNPAFRILAANPVAVALLGRSQLDGGALAYVFLDADARHHFANWDAVARAAVSALRLSAGYATPHPEVRPLVDRLLAESPEFAALWADQTVAGLALTEKAVNHPDVGSLRLTYQTFDVRDAPGQQLTVASAPVGSPSADALALLGTLVASTGAER
jgi:transcriptional regulator with XRE-family HTH domain